MSLTLYNANYLLLMSQIDSSMKKSVSFSAMVSVILIPSRKELFDTNLSHELWWSNKDFNKFRTDCLCEMIELKRKHPDITRRQMLKLLYQPRNIAYDESNFF
jgi:hypothetical protein